MAEGRGNRRPTAPGRGAVDHIVMDERCRVGHLDCHGGRNREVGIVCAAHGSQHDERRPDPFASRFEQLHHRSPNFRWI